MSKKGLTEIVCLMDKSESMGSIKKDVIGGFNKLIKSQKEEDGQALITAALFDEDYKYLYFGTDIKNVKRLTKNTYAPSGKASFLDAVGKAINEVGVRLSDTPEEERPEKVIFTVLNCGEENSGSEYTREQIFNKIKLQTDVYKWQFVFLAANQDAAKSAGLIGIDNKFANSFPYSGEGIRKSFDMMSKAISSYRQTGAVCEDWGR